MKHTATLTVAHIRALLASGELGDDDLRALECDSRQGVAKALAARRRRLERRELLITRARILTKIECDIRAGGVELIAGVDEVGVGPLAGPVVAAAVILPASPQIYGIDDSKKLSPKRRTTLSAAIRDQALGYALAMCGPDEIDAMNIYRASILAMKRAVLALDCQPDHLLVDARSIDRVDIPQTSLVRGDSRSVSIAAASILAKVARDALMRDYADAYPGYGFDRHMGYPTKQHVEALRTLGPCPIHRRSFGPVSDCVVSLP